MDDIDYTELIVVSIVYGLTFLVGMVGNLLIVYSVVQFNRMKSVSNVFLASLATADLILIIFCVPVKFAQLFTYTWTFGTFLCKGVHYVQNLTAICSVTTLTAISIERYYAIMYPMECRSICTMSQAKRVIMLTWCTSCLLASPILYIQILYQVGEAPHDIGYWCVRDWDHRALWQAYELYMLTVILVIPFVIMTYSYVRITRRLYTVMRERTVTFPLYTQQHQAVAATGSGNATSQAVYIEAPASKMSQVIKMLIVVVIIFVLCWTPILVLNVLAAFDIVPVLNFGIMKPIKTAFHLFSYANSCVNPIIYGFMSSNFRASFKQAILKCVGCERYKKQHNSTVLRLVEPQSNGGHQVAA